jgi:hypothetical protein
MDKPLTNVYSSIICFTVVFPQYTSNESITALAAQHKQNTFIPCLIGFAGIYWMNLTARAQYLIINSSNETSFPACHA